MFRFVAVSFRPAVFRIRIAIKKGLPHFFSETALKNYIARFRRDHLPETVEDLPNQMVQLLVPHGEISFEESAVFIDGTKIDANANRYSFIRKTGTTNNQAKLREKIANELPLLLKKAVADIDCFFRKIADVRYFVY